MKRPPFLYRLSVNLAARVSSAAAGGEVLVTGQTAALVPDLEGVIFESRGRKSLRNVSEPVDLFVVLRAGEAGVGHFPIDPVCRMAVDPKRAPGRFDVAPSKGHITWVGDEPSIVLFSNHP